MVLQSFPIVQSSEKMLSALRFEIYQESKNLKITLISHDDVKDSVTSAFLMLLPFFHEDNLHKTDEQSDKIVLRSV